MEDGNIGLGVRNGTISFGVKATSSIADGFTRVSGAVTTVFETVEDSIHDKSKQSTTSKWADQPVNTVDGFRDGYNAIAEQFSEVKDNIILIPYEEYEKYGAAGYITGMMKVIPLAIIKPVIGTTTGATRVITGVANGCVPTGRKYADGKWGAEHRRGL